jgi:hypothetical protein
MAPSGSTPTMKQDGFSGDIFDLYSGAHFEFPPRENMSQLRFVVVLYRNPKQKRGFYFTSEYEIFLPYEFRLIIQSLDGINLNY